MIALEGEVRIRERELRDHHLQFFRHLGRVADAKLTERLRDFWIVRLGGAELERFRLPDQSDVLDAHRGSRR